MSHKIIKMNVTELKIRDIKTKIESPEFNLDLKDTQFMKVKLTNGNCVTPRRAYFDFKITYDFGYPKFDHNLEMVKNVR